MKAFRFKSLEASAVYARELLVGGYQRSGKWTLGQVLRHLALTMEMSRTGFAGVTLPPGGRLLGYPVKWWVLRWGFPKGVKAPELLVFGDFTKDDEAVEIYDREVAAFAAHEGPMARSPLFGVQTKEMWQKIHLRHAEHHLGFLTPAGAVTESVAAKQA